MSLSKMVGLHPDVKGDVNELLVTAARHSMPCSLFCTSSADACFAETMPPQRLLRSSDTPDTSGAELTVIVTVLLFRGADLAGLDAGLDLGAWKVLARPTDRQARRGAQTSAQSRQVRMQSRMCATGDHRRRSPREDRHPFQALCPLQTAPCPAASIRREGTGPVLRLLRFNVALKTRLR